MKKSFTILFFTFIFFSVNAQENLYGIQTGVLGLWGNVERAFTDKISIKAELGLETALWGSLYYEDDNTNYAIIPVITIEPRWYFNITKRLEQGKRISKKSANFLAISLNYNPNLFVISNVDYVKGYSQIRIIPKWAIRRTVFQHFTYEVGLGLGYRRAFFDESDYLFTPDKGEVILDLHIRLGYTF